MGRDAVGVDAAWLRDRTARAVISEALDRAAPHVGRSGLGIFVHLQPARALAAADRIDAALRGGASPGPLAGVPIAIKDNLAHAGEPLTACSRILDGYRAPETAPAVARLEAAGAVVIGRTNMDEFGMGSSTEHSARHPTRNPRDPTRAPGGSSGGSAAAVAAGIVPLALGSDTGGSVRQPAALCGVVGMRPTMGRVSRRGLVAFASSMDQIGPLARSAEGCARALRVMAGPDPGDLSCCTRPLDAPTVPAEVTLGVLPTDADPGVAAAVAAALEVLQAAGARLAPRDVPAAPRALAAYAVLSSAEASSNLARYDGRRFGAPLAGEDGAALRRLRTEGFGAEVQRRLLLGAWVSAEGHGDRLLERARQARSALTAQLEAALAGVHALVLPTSPTVAFTLGSRTDPAQMARADRLTVLASLAGLPALSLPCGVSGGLPVGLQLIGHRWGDAALLGLAARVAAALRPPVPS